MEYNVTLKTFIILPKQSFADLVILACMHGAKYRLAFVSHC